MLLALVVGIFTVVACLFFAGKQWFPDAISLHAQSYDSHFHLTLLITGIIFILAQLALGYAVFRYRDRGQRVVFTRGSNRLEILWTSATAILFIGLMLGGSSIWANLHFAKPPAESLRVEVMAKQFAWSFRYPGPDGRLGKTDVKMVNDAAGNPFGIDESDPAGKDDIVTSVLRVPEKTPVVLSLNARDVIHSFFVRELRLKQDVVPGMVIPLIFQADKIGKYEVACAELCGLGHHQMRSVLQVMSQEAFDEWLREAK
ncbi:MAG: cytochrome c oxidase subunit II [Bryobacteraceae bacterium]